MKTTVGDALPKVQQNMANIRATICRKLKVALASVNAKSAAWKERRGHQDAAVRWSSRRGMRARGAR